MKKGIIVLLIMVMVAGFAFAAEPAFSGRIKAGYIFNFGQTPIAYDWGNGKELRLDLSFVGDFWKVTVKGLDGVIGKDGTLAGNVEMDIDKLVNMGDFKLQLNAGNNSNTNILSSFNDWKDDEYYKLKLNAANNAAAKITMGYKNVKFQIALDPTTSSTSKLTETGVTDTLLNNVPEGVTAGVAYTYDLYTKDKSVKGGSYAASIQGSILDAISLSAGYVYNAKTRAVGKDTNGYAVTGSSDSWLAKNAIGASASIDIAKLAGMENSKFKLSFYDNVLIGLGFQFKDHAFTFEEEGKYAKGTLSGDYWLDKGVANDLAFNIEGGYGKTTADVEFRAFNTGVIEDEKVMAYNDRKFSNFGLRAKVAYAFNENWGAKITGGVDDFSDAKANWDLGGGFNFKIFNVDFGWTASENAFAIKPYFDLVF